MRTIATISNESSPFDNNGHGTHVAGIVGARIGGPTSGGREFAGVAPDASLYSLKVMDGEQGSILDVIEAIDWAIANDMDIINLSLGLSDHVQLLKDAVDRAYKAGILLVGAAGNDDVGFPVNYPAKYDSVIAVSSVDRGKTISSFSSTGAEVEFSAPGGGIASTYVAGGISTYAQMDGTSQATPHIAGFLALLKQKNPTKTAPELRVELRKYAEDLGVQGRDDLYGYGFINYTVLDETAPGNVSNFKTTGTESDSIIVSFTNPADADFSKTKLYLNGVFSGETAGDSFTFTSLNADTEYQITARTVDVNGNTSEGVSIMAKTRALPDATPPAEQELPGTPTEPGNQAQPPVSPAPSQPGNQEQLPVNPAPSLPLPSGPIEAAPVPVQNGEFLVSEEKWTETNNKIEISVPAKASKFVFTPGVWNELKMARKDLSISLNGLSVLMPKENIAALTLKNKTEINFSPITATPPKGANLKSELIMIEMVDQVSKTAIKSFNKPINIAFDIPAATSTAAVKPTFGVRHDSGQWQFAGGNIRGSQFVIQTKQPGSFAIMENSRTFTDIKGHWAQPEIEDLSARLIIQGKTADQFSPNEEVTRAQFVVLLTRMLSIPTAEYAGTFKDVTASQSWSASYIEAAHRYGITTGFADGSFRPNQIIITRQEMAAMIVRALKAEKPEALLSSSKTTKPFTDDRKLSTTFKQEIYLAAKAGLIKGRANGSFDPLDKTTRAETSVVLYRALHK